MIVVKIKETRGKVRDILPAAGAARRGAAEERRGTKESHGRDIRKCSEDIFPGRIICGTIRRTALAATSAHEYDTT